MRVKLFFIVADSVRRGTYCTLEGSGWTLGEASSGGGQCSIEKGCPGRLRILHPWQFSRLGRQIRGWPALTSAVVLLWVGDCTGDLQEMFQPALLWFHNSLDKLQELPMRSSADEKQCIRPRYYFLGQLILRQLNTTLQWIKKYGNTQMHEIHFFKLLSYNSFEKDHQFYG